MSIYKEWGFMNSPFDTNPLEPTEEGKSLLIGRSKDIEKIRTSLSSSTNLITIEGNNGIGKTSLTNVALFIEYKKYLNNETDLLFVPCKKRFQLNIGEELEDFIDRVYIEIAQTLISVREEIEINNIIINKLDEWINSIISNSISFGIQIVSAGSSKTINTSPGFNRSGFRKHINDLLEDTFPKNSGGIVCILDNIELMETCNNVRKNLEYLRDSLFSTAGIRWILCGARDIFRGVTSPRLSGKMNRPIDIKGVNKEYITDLFDSRINYYAFDKDDYYIPLTSSDFRFLYELLNENLRETLNYTQSYCEWVYNERKNIMNPKADTDREKTKIFFEWLDEESKNKQASVNSHIGKTALTIFRKAVNLKGSFSPSDYAIFGYKKPANLSKYIKELYEIGLFDYIVDDADSRRRTVQITSEGWFFAYACGFHRPE